MTTPTAMGVTPRGGYGMGAVAANVAGHRVIWHNGALSSGYHGVLAYYPDDSVTVVVLMNSYPAKPEEFGEALFRAWAGLPISVPRPVPSVTSASATQSVALPLEAYAGTYVVGPLNFVVNVEGAGLSMIDPNGGTMTLKAIGPNAFAAERDETFKVMFDVEGNQATQLRIDSPRAKAQPARRVSGG
jgi:D-alanyl-D-alanine carboxypeptidase